MRTRYTPPSSDELSSLIVSPPDSIQEQEEAAALAVLLELAGVIGYVRLSQLTQQMEDLWHHPEKLREYQAIKADQLTSFTHKPTRRTNPPL